MKFIFFMVSLIFVISCLNICAVNVYEMLGKEVKHAFLMKFSGQIIKMELLGKMYSCTLGDIYSLGNDFIIKSISFLIDIWEKYLKTFLNQLADFLSSVMLYL